MEQGSERLCCDHCSRPLVRGRAEYYAVRIEAIADPTPPRISGKDQDLEEIRRQIAALFEKLKDRSEQEAIDQVFKIVMLTLCNACYQRWIENPTNA